MPDDREWRCFHCDEVFTNAEAAAKHFGVAQDHRPGCVEKLTAPEKNLVLALRGICDEFRRLQNQVLEEITNDVYFYGRLRQSLATMKPFEKCISLHDVFMLFDSLEGRALAAEAERDRLAAAINTPHTKEFLVAVEMEAIHQRERWGTEQDAGKEITDWYWLIGYLAGKAVLKPEKRLHHIITTAAACLNWHAAAIGVDTSMRPGIEAPPA